MALPQSVAKSPFKNVPNACYSGNTCVVNRNHYDIILAFSVRESLAPGRFNPGAFMFRVIK